MLSNIGKVIFQRTRIWRLLAAWLVSRKAYILSYSTDKMSSEIYAQKNSFDPIICIVFLIIQHNSQRYTIMWMCTYEKWRSNSKICSHWGTTKIITLVYAVCCGNIFTNSIGCRIYEWNLLYWQQLLLFQSEQSTSWTWVCKVKTNTKHLYIIKASTHMQILASVIYP